MPAKLARGALKDHATRFHGQGRHRIGLGARGIKRTGTGLAGHANLPFDLGVVRLEVGVGDGPIGQRGTGDGTYLAALDEIDFVEAPEIRGEMYTRAADEAAVDKRALWLGFVFGSFAKRSRLELGMIGE
jgi:hypothetical protein